MAAENPAPSSVSVDSEPSPKNITLLGTGLFGRALASHVRNQAPVHTLVVSSRSSAIPCSQAVRDADFVILAVPASAHSEVLQTIAPNLKQGAVLVDVSNRPLKIGKRSVSELSTAHALRKQVPPGVHVAKAFNTLSAQQLSSVSRGGSGNIIVPFAADGAYAKREMEDLISDMGFAPRHWGSLADASSSLERLPHALFPSYRAPMLIAAVVWTWWILYSILSTFTLKGNKSGRPNLPWERAPLTILIASTGETAMTLFGLVFLAGPVARLLQLARGNVSREFGKFMTGWLDARKELGLVAFVFISAHGIGGAVHPSHLEDGYKGRLYLVFGIMSFVMFALLALCSGDSFAASMSWAEFHTVFSWLGTAALVFGVSHQVVWGVILLKHKPDPSYWVGNGVVMPVYWLGIILPLAALFLRAVTWTPCISLPLSRLAQGRRVSKAEV